MSPRVEHLADGVSLYLGDCREILPTLPRAPAMITDPPYGVNIGAHKALRDNRPHLLRKGGYESYDDTPENFDAIIVPALTLALGQLAEFGTCRENRAPFDPITGYLYFWCARH